MLNITLMRHGITRGNLLRRYIGSTDEPLYEEGIKVIKKIKPPETQVVISSPLRRCVQTANLLFPNKEIIIKENLRECEFGDFENKNYRELCENKDYQAWIDSNATLPFPNGESVEAFKRRCKEEFEKTIMGLLNKDEKSAVFVIHGGTIMSIMESFADEKKGYYEWSVKNLEGYRFEVDEKMHLIGIEPTPLAPEAKALSIELQMHTTKLF